MPATKKVLIVDDEQDFLALLKDALEIRGLEVATAVNAVEAGIMLATQRPALILMDIRMPGINGLQACEAIRRNPATKDIPVIIITGLSEDSYKKKAYKIGVLEYYTKPVDIENLIKKIKEIIDRR